MENTFSFENAQMAAEAAPQLWQRTKNLSDFKIRENLQKHVSDSDFKNIEIKEEIHDNFGISDQMKEEIFSVFEKYAPSVLWMVFSWKEEGHTIDYIFAQLENYSDVLCRTAIRDVLLSHFPINPKGYVVDDDAFIIDHSVSFNFWREDEKLTLFCQFAVRRTEQWMTRAEIEAVTNDYLGGLGQDSWLHGYHVESVLRMDRADDVWDIQTAIVLLRAENKDDEYIEIEINSDINKVLNVFTRVEKSIIL